jgi:hypothetical protein
MGSIYKIRNSETTFIKYGHPSAVDGVFLENKDAAQCSQAGIGFHWTRLTPVTSRFLVSEGSVRWLECRATDRTSDFHQNGHIPGKESIRPEIFRPISCYYAYESLL